MHSRAKQPPRCRRVMLCAAAALLLSAFVTPARSAGPPRGSVAPPITLKDLSGEEVRSADLAGRTLVLVFGELGHEGVRKTCADVLDVLGDPRHGREHPVPILVVAADRPAADLRAQAGEGRYPALILHDPAREAFGAYRVLALPTVVVIDRDRKVVYSMAGVSPRFRDLLAESLLVASGREGQEEFERSLALDDAAAPDPGPVRAARLAHLGDELARHGLDGPAEGRYTESLATDPACLPARLGRASLLLRQGRLAEAEADFRRALEARPNLAEVELGLAEVCVRRGGDCLAEAEGTVQRIMESDPGNAHAHYLMGLLHEGRGETAAAAADYRKAAELLLAR